MHSKTSSTALLLLLVACSTTRQDITEEITALATLRSKALVQQDTATLNNILAEDFHYITISGEVRSREAYIKDYVVSDGTFRWISQDLDSMIVKKLNGAAIITFRVLDKFVYDGVQYQNYGRSTFVYEVQGDSWKCVVGHTTKIE